MLIVKCPHCDSLTRYGPDACDHCGGNLPEKYVSPEGGERGWVCPICSRPGQVYTFFCKGCGRERICLEHKGASGFCETCESVGRLPGTAFSSGLRRVSSVMFGLGAASLCFGGMLGRFSAGLITAVVLVIAGFAALKISRFRNTR